jgi:hypothetical protein
MSIGHEFIYWLTIVLAGIQLYTTLQPYFVLEKYIMAWSHAVKCTYNVLLPFQTCPPFWLDIDPPKELIYPSQTGNIHIKFLHWVPHVVNNRRYYDARTVTTVTYSGITTCFNFQIKILTEKSNDKHFQPYLKQIWPCQSYILITKSVFNRLPLFSCLHSLGYGDVILRWRGTLKETLFRRFIWNSNYLF